MSYQFIWIFSKYSSSLFVGVHVSVPFVIIGIMHVSYTFVITFMLILLRISSVERLSVVGRAASAFFSFSFKFFISVPSFENISHK